jgi:hypothetical protein
LIRGSAPRVAKGSLDKRAGLCQFDRRADGCAFGLKGRDIYLALARQRLGWFLRTTGNLVVQHWQVVALACLLVPDPPVIAIFLHFASFLQSPASPALDVAQRFALALAIDERN